MAEVSVISGDLSNKETYYLPEGFYSTNQGYPILGVDVQILDENKQEITEPNKEGMIVLKQPGPLMSCICFWGNQQAFIDKYYADFPGYFKTGDVGCWDDNRCVKVIRREEELLFLKRQRCCAKLVQGMLMS